jgi:hypothetical protein
LAEPAKGRKIVAMRVALVVLFATSSSCGHVVKLDPDAMGDAAQDAGACGACTEYEYCRNATCYPAAVYYLNLDADGTFVYDGTNATQVPNGSLPANPVTNTQSYHAGLAGTLLPYGTGPKRDTMLNIVRGHFADFNVVLTTTRPPASVAYNMLVLTGTNPFGDPNVVSNDSRDCNNSNTKQVEFLYISAGDVFTARGHANLVSAKLGNTIGLDPTMNDTEVMYPFLNDKDVAFHDSCLPLHTSRPTHCAVQHSVICSAAATENQYAELRNAFGLKADND